MYQGKRRQEGYFLVTLEIDPHCIQNGPLQYPVIIADRTSSGNIVDSETQFQAHNPSIIPNFLAPIRACHTKYPPHNRLFEKSE